MRSMFHLAAAALLAFTMACSQQRAQDDKDRQNASGGANTTAQSDANATAPGEQAERDTANLTQDDRQFVMEAGQGGKAEVQIAELAQDKSQNDQVKQLAQRIADDHKQANQDLERIAGNKQISLPQDLGKHQQHLQKFSRLNGAAFDKAFVQQMIQDHTEEIAKFRTESTKTNDASLKDFTTRVLPTLEEHLRMSKETAAQVK